MSVRCRFGYLFFFLSNYQTLKIFVILFSGTVRPRRLKLGTHMDSGWLYCVYWNQAATIHLSLYFFIFLSLQFSNKNFRHTFLRNCDAYKVETWYTCGQWVAVSCVPESGCYCLFVTLFFIFLSNFQTLNIFVTFFSGTVKPRRLNLVHRWIMGGCIVYTGIMLLLLFVPLFFHFSFQFSSIKNFRLSFLRNCEA